MKKIIGLTILVLALVLGVQAASADPGTLYVDEAESCDGNLPCYPHPQDAVNAANPGDTVLVYPGTYGSRYFVCDIVHPTWCAFNDNWAPALIVYKDGLTIKSMEGPSNTTIESTHVYWSNAIAVKNSTDGGIVGVSSWSPNAITVVANNVTIEGFTIHRPFEGTYATYNTAGVFIGSKASGYPDYLGQANGATIQNNVFSDVWHAVYIWHSSGNQIVNNTVAELNTNHWAAISTYDGYDDEQIALGNLSENNLIAHNILANKGISLGAWAPTNLTSNAGSEVCCNNTTQVGVAYSHGPVIIGCNTGGFWQSNTDNVLRITGISLNTGDTVVFPVGTAINLSAQLTYDGSADGSGVPVTFLVDGNSYAATTVAGGTATISVNDLVAGIYDVKAETVVCEDCIFTSQSQFLVVYDPSGGFVTGGGWIDSPPGAVDPIPTLVWDQGFETDTAGWDDTNASWYGAVSRVASGTSGIASSAGAYHAIFEGDASSAPFSRFDGYRSIWPGTWIAEVDVYLDPAWASGTGFDYSVAATGSDGGHQRDYIFHVTKDTSTSKLIVAGSNNTNFAPREDLENINHYEVTSAGWYTFQHIFYEQSGALAVDLNLLDASGNVLFTETRSDASDTIPAEVGGNRYAWFTYINVGGGIEVDEHQLYIPFNPTGKANFGFVSKYKKGASVPTGNTEFVFQAGGLNFHSDVQEWLVVTGSNYAKFKGSGTINGAVAPNGDPYKFMIWAGDGTGSNGEDTFRIKIWWEDNGIENVVYDNGMDQVIGGGSIVVHTK